MPFFFVDDKFSDSKEVMAIPKRHRLAAVGFWTLCGAWSAGKMLDGFVPNDVVRVYAGRTDVVEILCNIRGPANENWALLERTDGGVRITNWAKWQRTRAQVKAYRDAESAKKRRRRINNSSSTREQLGNNSSSTREQLGNNSSSTREQLGNNEPAVTCDYSEMSPVEDPGIPRARGRVSPKPIPIPKRTTTHLSSDLTVSNAAAESISATPGADLVRAIIPSEHPHAVQTTLRIRASELIHGGTPTEIVEAALKLWLTKPNLGPNVLPSLVSEVIKTRDAPTHTNKGKPPHKMRRLAERAAQQRAVEQLAIEQTQAVKELA